MTMNNVAFSQTVKTTEKFKFEKINEEDLLATITMLAVGVIAGKMAANCTPVTMDIGIAAAGGIAFVAGEIVSNIKMKAIIDEMTINVTMSSDGKQDEAQMARLKDLKKSYEEAKDAIETKIILQKAAAVAFAAAGIAAAYLAYQQPPVSVAICKTGRAASSSIINQMLFGSQILKIAYAEKTKKGSNNILDFIFPKAQASWIPLLGLGAGALATFMLAKNDLAALLDPLMNNPTSRGIVWAMLAGLSYAASTASEKILKQIEDNIKKIDSILNSMNHLAKVGSVGSRINNGTERTLPITTALKMKTSFPISKNGNITTDCATSSSTTNCQSLENKVAALPDFSTLPDSFRSLAGQSLRLGDSLSGTRALTGQARTSAANLAGKQNAVSKMLTNAKNKLNDKLTNSGKPKINFDKEQKDFLKKLNATTEKALRDGGSSAAGFLSSYGGMPSSAGDESSMKEEVATKKSSAPIGGEIAPAAKNKGLDLDFKEVTTDPVAAEEKGAEEKFDIGTNDINTNAGESIFQVISNRYIRSGYPRLFDELPTAPAAEPESVKN